MKFQILIIIYLFGSNISHAVHANISEITDEDNVIYQKYFKMDKQLKKIVDQVIKSTLPYIVEANEHIRISSECTRNILTLTSGIRKLKLWAFNFLDTTGKVSDSILSSNVHMLGNFDQCLRTTVYKKSGNMDFRGEYCLLEYKLITPKPRRQVTLKGGGFEEFISATKNSSDVIQFLAKNANMLYLSPAKFGVCVPSGCSEQDIGQIVKYVGESIMINASVHSCQIEGSLPVINKRNIVIICIFSAFGLLGVIGSILQHFQKERDSTSQSTLKHILLCFSITSNFQKVLSTKTPDESLTCLHGIRVLSLFWIVLSHRNLHSVSINITKQFATRFVDWLGQCFSQILLNGFLVVDVFFFMGGLIHCYARSKKEKHDKDNLKKMNIGFVKIIILRLWRLYPAYIFSTLLAVLFVSRGPLAPMAQEKTIQYCERYWWRNILFISNFFEQSKMCNDHTWYVCVDFQLFLVSLYPVSLLVRNVKKGVFANATILIIGIIISIIWTFFENIAPTFLFSEATNEQVQLFQRVYISPFTHLAPYFAGVFLGHILATNKDIKLSKVWQIIGWLIATASFLSMLFITTRWNTGVVYTRFESALYITFSKLLFSLSVGWMIFCCAIGKGGIINYILSMKLWVPLSKISFMVYLVSPILQKFYITNLRSPFDLHEMTMIWNYMGDLVISCLLSLAAVVLVESPFISLQKVILQKHIQETKKIKKSDEVIINNVIKAKELNNLQSENNKMFVITKF